MAATVRRKWKLADKRAGYYLAHAVAKRPMTVIIALEICRGLGNENITQSKNAEIKRNDDAYVWYEASVGVIRRRSRALCPNIGVSTP
jgi:hypothetical protein